MVFLSCCVEKQGYYNSGEESIIALICDITWTGGKKEYEDGSSWESIWNFDKDGTYTRTNVEIDKDGNKKEGEIRGRWSFYTPNFSTLYFGGSHYWDIKELDKTIFSFYDTFHLPSYCNFPYSSSLTGSSHSLEPFSLGTSIAR